MDVPAAEGDVDSVRLLIQQKVDVNARNQVTQYRFVIPRPSFEGRIFLGRQTAKIGFFGVIQDGLAALHIGVDRGHEAVVRALLEGKSKVDIEGLVRKLI